MLPLPNSQKTQDFIKNEGMHDRWEYRCNELRSPWKVRMCALNFHAQNLLIFRIQHTKSNKAAPFIQQMFRASTQSLIRVELHFRFHRSWQAPWRDLMAAILAASVPQIWLKWRMKMSWSRFTQSLSAKRYVWMFFTNYLSMLASHCVVDFILKSVKPA